MIKSNLATYPRARGYSYTENLGKAARAFVTALFAVQPSKNESQVFKSTAIEESVIDVNLVKLYKMASGFDSVSPRLATELRHIANSK